MAASEQHLDHAPIVEALVDFRVELAPDFDPLSFHSVREQLASQYPNLQVMRVVEGNIRVSGEEVSQSTSDSKLFGFRLGDDDSTRIAQLRTNGFTFSKLRPYTSWNDVFSEAWRIWELYLGVAHPELITRVAVRYINHIVIPFPFAFVKYFTDPPTIPDDLPQDIAAYFKRVTVVDAVSDLSANIIQAVDRPDPKAMRFLLDIDVYRQHSFDPMAEDLRAAFDDLRALKNRIFFGSITDDALELFR